ncbi:MAG: hypothetical protein WCO78_03420 [Candidatus Roizmanbacteria bacterium]
MKRILLLIWTLFLLLQIISLYNNPLGYDDSYNASVAKNFALGHGYSTSYDQYTNLNEEITTGPLPIVSTALVIKLFGNSIYIPGIVTIILVHLVLVILLCSRWAPGEKRVNILLLFILFQIILLLSKLDFGFFQLLGEQLASVLLIAGFVHISNEKASRRVALLSFVLILLAASTKTISILMLGGFCMGSVLLYLYQPSKHNNPKYIVLSSALVFFIITISNAIFSTTSQLSQSSQISLISIYSHLTERIATLLLYFNNPIYLLVCFCSLVFVLVMSRRLLPQQFRVIFSLIFALSLHMVWWLFVSKENWIRHVFPSIILATFVLSYYLVLSKSKLYNLVIFFLVIFVPFVYLSKSFMNCILIDSGRSLAIAKTVNFLNQLKSNPRTDLYGCGWWWSNRDLEYAMPSSLNFKDARNYPALDYDTKDIYFVRNSSDNWDNIPICNSFRVSCEKNIIYEIAPYTVSHCKGT